MDKLTLYIHQYGHKLYGTDDILEFNLDPLSYSGVDYWKQEARSCKIKLLFDNNLKQLLESSPDSLKCGFYGYRFTLVYNNVNLFVGILPVGGIAIDYLSLTAKTVELELIDCFGLLLKLAEDRPFPLNSGYLNPVGKIPEIIRHILNPDDSFLPPDTESYSNADVRALRSMFGAINYQYAHYTYNFENWLAVSVIDQLLLDSHNLEYNKNSEIILFGFQSSDNMLYLIYYEVHRSTQHYGNYIDHFRYRKYKVNAAQLTLEEAIDESTDDPNYNPITPLPEPELVSAVQVSNYSYRIHQGKALFTGQLPLDSVEVVAGTYNAKDLLAEYLQISNAVLTLDEFQYGFQIKNRYDHGLANLLLVDPLEFKLEPSSSGKTDISAVSLASQAIIDAVNNHYDALLKEFNYEANIKLHILAADYISFQLASPYELINYNLLFDNYIISPNEIEYNMETGEIEIKGRAKNNE